MKERLSPDQVLPRIAADNLLTAVFESVDLAAEGLVADGYEVMLIGKQRALEGEQNFAPTEEAVEAAWDGAIRRYARRWGIGRR